MTDAGEPTAESIAPHRPGFVKMATLRPIGTDLDALSGQYAQETSIVDSVNSVAIELATTVTPISSPRRQPLVKLATLRLVDTDANGQQVVSAGPPSPRMLLRSEVCILCG